MKIKYTPKELKDNVNISTTSPLKEFFILLGGILGILLIIYIALGFAVDFVVPKLPREIEKRLGALYSNRYKESRMRLPMEMELQRILDELIKEFPSGERDYKVYLAHRPETNALALPGGNIVVFLGLVKEVKSENEVAFVLAHELGHYAHRDHLRGLGRRLVLLTISTIFLGADNTVTKFIQNSMVNVEMKFSQRQERQADSFALDLLNRRYGHIGGATDFLEKMSRKERMGRFLYFFASHPYPKDRVKALEDQIQKKGYLAKEKLKLSEVFKGAQGLPRDARKELEERVERLLEEDNVTLRRDINDVFTLADLYASEGNDDEAIRLYQKALQVDGWRLEYQLKLARILSEHTDRIQAIEKAKLVYDYAEDENLIDMSEKFLSQLGVETVEAPKEEIPLAINESIEIAIVPIGKINRRFLSEVRNELQKRLGIKYSIAENGFDLGKADRQRFEHSQFDASRLLSDLQKNYVIGERPELKGYLGITEGDIFSDDFNFLFGWARKVYGVMSYHRFTAKFNDEPPNRSRLRARTIKQAISSSFHIFGIPRCTTPTCVRAYPHSLTEHDQKGYELCSWCREQLNNYIKGQFSD